MRPGSCRTVIPVNSAERVLAGMKLKEIVNDVTSHPWLYAAVCVSGLLLAVLGQCSGVPIDLLAVLLLLFGCLLGAL